MNLSKEQINQLDKRKTFAIISHPDAGKTTMTEKLLLFGGAIQMAGTVKAKKSKQFATSDWMEIEKQRGISVTSSVMKFQYKEYDINLLDTPGHQDFSEDTYRVLTAVDSCLMVIDGAKGVETQTIKLLDACRIKKTPIMSFINKFDRECKDPFDILQEIESILKIVCVPITWPIGMGKEFKGIYDILNKRLELYQPSQNKITQSSIVIEDILDAKVDELIGEFHANQLREEIELISIAGNQFDIDAYNEGKQTPVFFGSAINNFGVQEFLNNFLHFAPKPLPRQTDTREIQPIEKQFTGFIFKIQANMDANHRDRIAFLRICSGKFEKGMTVKHCRTKKDIKLSNIVSFMAQKRDATEIAYAGDIIGIHDKTQYAIGDTLTEKEIFNFIGIPNFSPEHFQRVRLENPLFTKQLNKGLNQLSEEGSTQVFRRININDTILGVVGQLQFEVVKFRLQNEYGVESSFLPIDFITARWYRCDDEEELGKFEKKYQDQLAYDKKNSKVFLVKSLWDLDFAQKKFEKMLFFNNSDYINQA